MVPSISRGGLGWGWASDEGKQVKGQTNTFVLSNRIQRKLRRDLTDAERALWRRLRGGQIMDRKFRRQHPYGDFILDFVCLEAMLVIEVDGGQHNESRKDEVRDQTLMEAGFRVIRFWNNQVLNELDVVLEVIKVALETRPHPNLPPEGEGTTEENHDAK